MFRFHFHIDKSKPIGENCDCFRQDKPELLAKHTNDHDMHCICLWATALALCKTREEYVSIMCPLINAMANSSDIPLSYAKAHVDMADSRAESWLRAYNGDFGKAVGMVGGGILGAVGGSAILGPIGGVSGAAVAGVGGAGLGSKIIDDGINWVASFFVSPDKEGTKLKGCAETARTALSERETRERTAAFNEAALSAPRPT